MVEYKSDLSRRLETIPVTIRQVPGDGNCLFHSISVGLYYVEKKKHLRMRNQSYTKSSGDSDYNSHCNIKGDDYGYGDYDGDGDGDDEYEFECSAMQGTTCKVGIFTSNCSKYVNTSSRY
mmetsp:Transcript_10871/g.16439  ORF Transcript_10871/g.16439 Transcript_10871/m.16439 type:complete len:120 (-) Transcript_10871:856-1215(-)